jgi:hypothetical protein
MISPTTIINQEQSEEYPDESSQVSADDSNLYEAIEDTKDDKTSTAYSDCSDQDSLYLNISKGRRNHLQLHRNVGWDFDIHDEGGDDGGHSRLGKMVRQVHYNVIFTLFRMKIIIIHIYFQNSEISQTNISRDLYPTEPQLATKAKMDEKRKLNIEKSLSRTLSSIVISIRKMF